MFPSYLTYEVHHSPRWSTFLAGLVLDLGAVALVVSVGAHLNSVVVHEPFAAHRYVTLISPARIVYEARRNTEAPPQLAELEEPRTPPVAAHVTVPRPHAIEATAVKPHAREVPKAVASAPSSPAKPAPAPAIKTNVFAAAKSEIASVQQPARKVQTGGFGDPNGLPGQGDAARNTVSTVRVGSFALPQGPGEGNGTSGSHGVSRVVRSSGFGDRGTSQTIASRNDGNIKASGFGDVVAQTAAATPQPVQKRPNLQPVQITYKPQPEYTAEARRRRVEGEVLLDVLFTASGSLRIQRVVKGLGYGLDDKALAAAEQIRFHPALRDGQPYDCAALVHIRFELAD